MVASGIFPPEEIFHRSVKSAVRQHQKHRNNLLRGFILEKTGVDPVSWTLYSSRRRCPLCQSHINRIPPCQDKKSNSHAYAFSVFQRSDYAIPSTHAIKKAKICLQLSKPGSPYNGSETTKHLNDAHISLILSNITVFLNPFCVFCSVEWLS